jgi:hypothetical protein
LTQPFEFSVDSERYVVPEGFWTDFASVPRILWAVLSPYDLGVGPIPHDFGYYTGFANKLYWDLVFLSCMKKDEISEFKSQATFRAVEWFGGKVWDGYRSRSSVDLHPIRRNGVMVRECVGWKPRTMIGEKQCFRRPVGVDGYLWKENILRLTGGLQ